MVNIRKDPAPQSSKQVPEFRRPTPPSISQSSNEISSSAPPAAVRPSPTQDISTNQTLESASMTPQELNFNQPQNTERMTPQEAIKLLQEQLGEIFEELPEEEKQKMIEMLQSLHMSSEDLTTPTMQGANQIGTIADSLKILAETNRLTPEVLSAIEDLSQADMHHTLNAQRSQILQSALHEIANPHCIAQQHRGTCAATVPQAKLAIEDPARYLNLVRELTSPDGRVSSEVINSNHGIGMVREGGTINPDGSHRTITSRLIQPAFMEYANGHLDYDNNTDRHSDGTGGLLQRETTALLNGLFGSNSHQTISIQQGLSPQNILQQIKPFLEQGVTVPIGMVWSSEGMHAGHEVMLTSIDEDHNKAYFYNPWGELKSMPLDVLASRIQDASIPTSMEHAAKNSLSNLKMSDTSNYENMSMAEFNPYQHFGNMDNVSDEHMDSITELLDNHDLSGRDLDNLTNIIENSPEEVLQSILDSLNQETELIDISSQLDIYSTVSELPKVESEQWLSLINQWLSETGFSNENEEFYDVLDTVASGQMTPADFSHLLDRQPIDFNQINDELSQTEEGHVIPNDIRALFNQIQHSIHTEGAEEEGTTQDLIQQTIERLNELSLQEYNIEESLSQLKRLIGENIEQHPPENQPYPSMRLLDF